MTEQKLMKMKTIGIALWIAEAAWIACAVCVLRL